MCFWSQIVVLPFVFRKNPCFYKLKNARYFLFFFCFFLQEFSKCVPLRTPVSCSNEFIPTHVAPDTIFLFTPAIPVEARVHIGFARLESAIGFVISPPLKCCSGQYSYSSTARIDVFIVRGDGTTVIDIVPWVVPYASHRLASIVIRCVKPFLRMASVHFDGPNALTRLTAVIRHLKGHLPLTYKGLTRLCGRQKQGCKNELKK